MLVFVEQPASNGALALLRAATKQELPLEDLVIVAAKLAASNASTTPPRQLTCISARVKPIERRVLLALPIAVAAVTAVSSSENTAMQILDTGDVAVQFARDVRSCFPTLVRRSPMASDSDDDDESDTDADDTDSSATQRASQRHAEHQHTKQVHVKQLQNAERSASAYMDRTRVKLLASLDELLDAFAVVDIGETRAALELEERAVLARNSSSVTAQCQWLCVDLPAAATATSSNSSTASVHNVGLLFSHAVLAGPAARFLTIPLPRSLPYTTGAADACELFQDATVLSFNTKREATAHGGGKTPAEMVANIRMRHASGTFVTLVEPTTTWATVAASYSAILPLVQAVEGELRLRRVVGPTTNESLELLLMTGGNTVDSDSDNDSTS